MVEGHYQNLFVKLLLIHPVGKILCLSGKSQGNQKLTTVAAI